LAGKLRFCQQSENHVHCDDAAFVPEFSEGNSGSSFFEWKWAAGSMSRLEVEVELQNPKREKWMHGLRFRSD
jgi:hypothetical protein